MVKLLSAMSVHIAHVNSNGTNVHIEGQLYPQSEQIRRSQEQSDFVIF